MFKLLTLLTTLLTLSSCAKILGIFPTPYYSHQIVTQALMKDLAARHHHLTILTTHPHDYNNLNVTQVHFNGTEKIYSEIVNQSHGKKASNILTQAWNDQKAYFAATTQQLGQREVQQLISDGKKGDFDLVIVECFDFCPMMAFAELYDCPIIVFTSIEMPFPLLELVGNEVNPVVHPEKFLHGSVEFVERLKASLAYSFYHLVWKHPLHFLHRKIVQKHFPQVSVSQAQLEDRIALLFTNSLSTNQPLLPNTVQLNFMHVDPPQALPDGELKTFLDSSANGAILVSLGSHSQPKDLDLLMKVFKSLPYNVLWKFEDELRNLPDNIFISSWLPQADILAHPNLKLFITHGGLSSVQESIDREVPMIIVPHHRATASELVSKGVARSLDLETLNEERLRDAIDEMMRPERMVNVKLLRGHFRNQPMTSRQKAVWYTEHVLRHRGAKHLEYTARHVPHYQRNCYDIILFVSLTVYLAFKAAESLRNRFFQFRRTSHLRSKKSA